MDVGTRIRAERKARKWSQEELARRAGVPLNRVQRIEGGTVKDPHLSTLAQIADGLDMSVVELLEAPGVPLAEAPPDISEGERREELERLGELLLDMRDQLEKDANSYRAAANAYDLETIAARAHLELRAATQLVENEVGPSEASAAVSVYEALRRMDELVADLVEVARSSREAEQRRSRLQLIQGQRAAG